jgi:hypothetical protein
MQPQLWIFPANYTRIKKRQDIFQMEKTNQLLIVYYECVDESAISRLRLFSVL